MIHIYCKEFNLENQEPSHSLSDSFSILYNQFIDHNESIIRCAKCPLCGNHGMIFYGTHIRKLILSSGHIIHIRVQRCQCIHCRHVHVILPSFIVPYHIHLFSAIKDFFANRSTVIDDSYIRKLLISFSANVLLSWPASLETIIHHLLSLHKFSYISLSLPT